jgi:hypothetical protein
MVQLVKFVRITATVLLLITGINALIAGCLFIVDPTGTTMGMSTTYLATSPFTNFLIPGLVLLVVNGVFNITAAIFVMRKHKHHPRFIIFQGLLLSGWIVIQIMMVKDFNLLHVSMLTIGVILIIAGIYLNRKN